MLVVKIVKGLVLLSLLVGASVVHAQDRIQANPAQKLFTFKLVDNSVIAADGVSRRFYLQTVNGGTLEMSFDEVIAHAEPDPAKRAALMATFEAALANPLNAGYFESGFPLGPDPIPCDPPCMNPEFPTMVSDPLSMMVSGGGEITDLDGVTVIRRRPSSVPLIGGDGGGVFWSSGYLGSYDPFGGGGGGGGGGETPVTYQQYWKDDFKRFERQRQAACGAATTNSFAFGANLGATLLSCGIAIAGTPVGGTGPALLGALCFAEGLLTVKAWGDMAEANATCAATYPGPGNW